MAERYAIIDSFFYMVGSPGMITYSLTDIASYIGGELVGDTGTFISGFSPINDIKANTIVLIKDKQTLSIAEQSLASAIVINKHQQTTYTPVIKVDNTKLAFIKLLTYFKPVETHQATVHKTACLEDNVTLGKNVTLAPYVCIGKGSVIGNNTHIKAGTVIGQHVTIGDDCVIHPHVTIYDDCVLANNVIIHASSVIGSDGFGYEFDGEVHQKVPHLGHVVIHAHVEIGANSVIDRATLGTTEIGQGSKIDNLVQIAHNVKIGTHNILCAFTGIAGSAQTGDHVVCAANVGISDHAKIGNKVILGPRSGVAANKRCPDETTWFGSPARLAKQAIEQATVLHRLPSLRKAFLSLQERVKVLEGQD